MIHCYLLELELELHPELELLKIQLNAFKQQALSMIAMATRFTFGLNLAGKYLPSKLRVVVLVYQNR